MKGSIYEPSYPWRWTRSNAFWAFILLMLSPILLLAAISAPISKFLAMCFGEPTQANKKGSSEDETAHNSSSYPSSLDYGIYWFGKGNLPEKFVRKQNNRFFDPTKPSVINVHGFQKTVTGRGFRETFNCYYNYGRNPGENFGFSQKWDVDAADAWIDQGWNVGCFYWNQFADEDDVKDAETKVWTDQGDKGMRWCRRRDESDRRICYVDELPASKRAPFHSISELLCQELHNVFDSAAGPATAGLDSAAGWNQDLQEGGGGRKKRRKFAVTRQWAQEQQQHLSGWWGTRRGASL
jgi:hypothetical protein